MSGYNKDASPIVEIPILLGKVVAIQTARTFLTAVMLKMDMGCLG